MFSRGLEPWPDAFDVSAIVAVGVLAIALPLIGYAFMVVDFRAYLRSLRRALVVAKGYNLGLPNWVVKDTPPCFRALGLRPPSSRDQILQAYRARVKHAHPDLGGSRREFARLQRHFEQAMRLASDASSSAD